MCITLRKKSIKQIKSDNMRLFQIFLPLRDKVMAKMRKDYYILR